MVKIISHLTVLFAAALSMQARAFTLAQAGFDGGWPGKSLAFYYNASNCPATVASALNKAFEIWSDVPTSNLKLKLGGASTATPAQLIAGTAAPVPAIVCDTAFETTAPGTNGDFVGGYGFFTHAGGKIQYGGIVLNVQAGKDANINNFDATSLAILLAHEMGHVLGLGHSEYHPALMYYDISTKEALTLSQDDIDGMTYLYPRDEFKDGIYGCARVSALPPATGMGAFICLLIPFLLLSYMRRKSSAVLVPDFRPA